MTMTDKEIKIVFSPGCFDNFDGSQEELDQLISDIRAMVEDGSLFDEAKILTEDDLEDLPPEVLESIARDMEMMEDDTKGVEKRKRLLN